MIGEKIYENGKWNNNILNYNYFIVNGNINYKCIIYKIKKDMEYCMILRISENNDVIMNPEYEDIKEYILDLYKNNEIKVGYMYSIGLLTQFIRDKKLEKIMYDRI